MLNVQNYFSATTLLPTFFFEQADLPFRHTWQKHHAFLTDLQQDRKFRMKPVQGSHTFSYLKFMLNQATNSVKFLPNSWTYLAASFV